MVLDAIHWLFLVQLTSGNQEEFAFLSPPVVVWGCVTDSGHWLVSGKGQCLLLAEHWMDRVLHCLLPLALGSATLGFLSYHKEQSTLSTCNRYRAWGKSNSCQDKLLGWGACCLAQHSLVQINWYLSCSDSYTVSLMLAKNLWLGDLQVPSTSKRFWFWKQVLTADKMLTGHQIGEALLRYFCCIMADEGGYLEQSRTLREQL